MRLAVAVLCDSASVREGTLGMLGGGLDTAWREEFPAPLLMTLALMLEIPMEETGQATPIEVAVIEASATNSDEAMFVAQGEINTERVPDSGVYVSMPLDLSQVTIPLVGDYECRISVAGEVHTVIPFRARLREQGT